MSNRIEKDAAAIIYHAGKTGRTYLLLLDGAHLIWDFPRGHVEEGESELAAAMRETMEETSLEHVIFDTPFCYRFKYEFISADHQAIEKHVVAFLARSDDMRFKLQPPHTAADFFTYEQARKKLKRQSARALDAAEKFLARNR